MNFKKLNNIVAWSVFFVATIVYFLTLESTVSWWDCGEYISTAYKLQVGHPPGAPLFQMIGRFFSLFAFGDVTKVALMINAMSALCSSFTILFLYWTITLLSRKIWMKEGDDAPLSNKIAVIATGVVGALAYTFSDSFWFNAVEGEVYAMSSLFSAITFWAILKWEQVADKPNNYRWFILIAYLIGLSIGVHLLNLLCIPAVVYVVYFKKYKKVTFKGFILAGIISVALVGFIQVILVPAVVSLCGKFELFFVNSLAQSIRQKHHQQSLLQFREYGHSSSLCTQQMLLEESFSSLLQKSRFPAACSQQMPVFRWSYDLAQIDVSGHYTLQKPIFL